MRKQKSAGGMKPLTITIPQELRGQLNTLSDQEGISVSAVVVSHLSRLAESQRDPYLAAGASFLRAVADAHARLEGRAQEMDQQAVRAAVIASCTLKLGRALGMAEMWATSGGGGAGDRYMKARRDLLDAVRTTGKDLLSRLQAEEALAKLIPDTAGLAASDLDGLDLAERASGAGAPDELIEMLMSTAGEVTAARDLVMRSL